MNSKDYFYKIGIIGVGMVGGTLQRYFEQHRGIKPLLYDNHKALGSPVLINQAEIIFICVPTPHSNGKGQNLSAVKDAVEVVERPRVIVIKSTVLPGTTEMLQEQFPHHTFLFNPEFLTEATADEDMQNPNRQIIGYTKKEASYQTASNLMEFLPQAPFQKIIPATEAEMVKYFNNTLYATKVAFANQIYDVCKQLGISYNDVKECVAADKLTGPHHLNIFHKGYRGYGGRCLSKDVSSFLKLADKLGVDLSVLSEVEQYNNRLIKNGQKNSEK